MKYVITTKDLVTGEIDKTVKLCEKAKDLLVETIGNSDEFEILEIVEVE